MKVLTFSKVFPQKHINAGEPTNFKEKILSGEKIHTIRPETNKWKIGDQISMRYWTDKPYHSKQEIFCEEFEVVEVIGIEINFIDKLLFIDEIEYDIDLIYKIAKNDGLSFFEFNHWFNKPFKGTLIAWQPTNY
jgi:hypothetical protein